MLDLSSSRIFILIDNNRVNKGGIHDLKAILSNHKKGNTEVFIHYKENDAECILSLGRDCLIILSAELINDLKNSEKINDVIWVGKELIHYPEYNEEDDIPF